MASTSASQPRDARAVTATDPQWRDLYRVATVAAVGVTLLVIIAIVVFFIWGYAPREVPTAEILDTLQTNLVGALFSLDLVLLITQLIMVAPLLALYVVLRPVNPSYALIALALGLISVVLSIVARPITELVYLSDQYSAATSEAARSQYLAAAETLVAIFDGTAWMIYTVFLALSTLITSVLMLDSPHFTRLTAWIGIALGVTSLGFFMPVVGPLLLLVATFGGIVWYVLVARVFYRLGWNTP